VSTLHYSQRLPGHLTSVPGLYFVNSSHIINGTLNVDETVGLAEETAVRLLHSSDSALHAEAAS
jgi:hypothetical protein